MKQHETTTLLLPRIALLAKFGDSAPLLATTAAMLLESWREDLGALKLCLAAQDSHGCTKAIHSLKGSIGFFAEDNFFQEAADMETMARCDRLDEVLLRMPGFELKLNRFVDQLEEMRESLC